MRKLDLFDDGHGLPSNRTDPTDPFHEVMELVCTDHGPYDKPLATYIRRGTWADRTYAHDDAYEGVAGRAITTVRVFELAVDHVDTAHGGIPRELLDSAVTLIALGSVEQGLIMLTEYR